MNSLITNKNELMPEKTESENNLIHSQNFSDAEREQVNYFFFRLKNIYGEKFTRQYPSELELNAVKREWAPKILELSTKELADGFDHVFQMMTKSEPGFDWPNPANVLAGAKRHANASHRLFKAEEHGKAPVEYGDKALEGIRKMLNHPRPKDMDERISERNMQKIRSELVPYMYD